MSKNKKKNPVPETQHPSDNPPVEPENCEKFQTYYED